MGVDVDDEVHSTAWEAFEVTDVVCLIAGLLAVVRAVVALAGPRDDPPVPGSVLVAGVGGVALALVALGTVNPPGVGANREPGLWIGLVATAGIVYGSYVSIQARRDRPPI